jgi:(p)ppGpp synthase/HD superfamily hydrolase
MFPGHLQESFPDLKHGTSTCETSDYQIREREVCTCAELEREVQNQSTTAWLAIECEDRSGILADVASTIAMFGGNIDVRLAC